jgi:prepilin-type N-terminal cleavage/methylation domain-containing protein
MKNIKLNTARKAGFSLVEMLVVIAIIGIIAAIAIPNIGNLNDSARDAAAKRNAQTIASVLNAAVAAGADSSTWTTGTLITTAEGGVSPLIGAFAGKTFTSGEIANSEEDKVLTYLTWDSGNKQVKYNPTPAAPETP